MENGLKEYLKGKTVLVTGGTGSIGSEIVRGLMNSDVKTIRILSNDENGVYELSEELNDVRLRFFVGDVRDRDRMAMACEDVDIVFHAAALKHVPLCEYNPIEAVKTNVLGTQNVIEACLAQKVGKMIFISTDKAIEPVNTMGASKLLAERLVIDANNIKGYKPTKFSIVRFGNVMGSRGSVIPLFLGQAMKGGPITLTSDEMTRFMMYIQDAVQLIFKATEKAEGGEIFSFNMPVMKMIDLAEVIREEISAIKGHSPDQIEIKTIGLRPGERLHEALMTEEEASRAKVVGELMMVLPISRAENSAINNQYRSDTIEPMSKDEIRAVIKKLQ